MSGSALQAHSPADCRYVLIIANIGIRRQTGRRCRGTKRLSPHRKSRGEGHLNSFALVLYTDTPVGEQPLDDMVARLGLIGDPVQVAGEQRYLVGDNFLAQIGFLGCSPDVNLSRNDNADQAGSAFVHVSIARFPSLTFLESHATRPPRCPHCRQALPDWPAAVQQWRERGELDTVCNSCETVIELPALDWRRTAGFASQAVYIWNVHEGEALPADILMQHLEKSTGSHWHYCYLQVAE